MIRERNMYAEVYEILEVLGSEYKDKLPIKLYEYIANNRNVEHICNFDTENLNNKRIMTDTVEFISYLNLMYWCDDETEKQRLISIYQKNEDKAKEDIKEKLTFNNNIADYTTKEVIKEVAIYKKESKLENIINKILKFLHLR